MNYIGYEVKERTGYITLNRPEKRNALNADVVTELKQAFRKAEADGSVKVIVLAARGEAFCAGADLEYLRQLQTNSYEENLQDSTHLMELFRQIYTLKKVVIAQVNGPAIAGGAGLVSVCDFGFCSSTATFGYTEVKIGFVPAIVMIFLIRKLGEAKAKELLLSGRIIDSGEARNIGLVYAVEESTRLEASVAEFAQKLCRQNSLASMSMTKEMISKVQEMSLEEALRYGAESNAKARATEDCRRGIASFLNKEKLIW